LVLPEYVAAKPWITPWRPRRVRALKVSKSWSRSTGVVVESPWRVASSASFGALSGPGESEM
jgi:hypothetical protein